MNPPPPLPPPPTPATVYGTKVNDAKIPSLD